MNNFPFSTAVFSMTGGSSHLESGNPGDRKSQNVVIPFIGVIILQVNGFLPSCTLEIGVYSWENHRNMVGSGQRKRNCIGLRVLLRFSPHHLDFVWCFLGTLWYDTWIYWWCTGASWDMYIYSEWSSLVLNRLLVLFHVFLCMSACWPERLQMGAHHGSCPGAQDSQSPNSRSQSITSGYLVGWWSYGIISNRGYHNDTIKGYYPIDTIG